MFYDSATTFELATFWIFPYFMESRVVEEMPSFKMCEFKVSNGLINVF